MNPPSAKQWLAEQRPLAGRAYFAALALHVLAAWLIIAQTGLLAHALHGAAFEHKTLSTLNPLLWALLALITLRALLTRQAHILSFSAAERIKQQLRQRLLQKLFALGPRVFQRWQSAHISQLLSEGIEALDDYYARYLPTATLCAFLPLGILLLVFPLDWKSALIFTVTAPLIPFFMILIGDRAERLNQARWQTLTRLGNQLFDRIRALPQLKLFNAAEREAARMGEACEQYRHSTLSVLKVAFLSSLALEFLATVSIAMVAVIVGFRLYWGSLDFATGLWLLLLAPEFYFPFRQLGVHHHARMAGNSAAEDMIELLQTPESHHGQALAHPLSPHSQLHLAHIHFAYRAEQAVLRGLSLRFQGPGLFALVGPSGSGKSTLMQILLGFEKPQSGQYAWDDVDALGLSREALQSQLSWLPQKAQLFYATVADNIRMGHSQASDAEIRAAAQCAGAEDFIQQLPQGYQTLVGEGGQGLSGGQIQRLALARALIKPSPILLLDEPSQHLDQESEAQLQAALARIARTHLLIVIAHRLSTLTRAKQIAVFEGGRCVEVGHHRELCAAGGVYRNMLGALAEYG